MFKYKVVRNVLEKQTIEYISTIMDLAVSAGYFVNQADPADTNRFNDGSVPNAFPFYSPVFLESLLTMLHPVAEEATGKRLFPSYSYGRIYWHNSEMVRHKDRPSCEYSMTVSISIDNEPWPIFMDGEPILLYPGDVAIYNGTDVEHWREPYTGQEQKQVFLHYVDQDGPHADYKFDRRPMLGLQRLPE